MIDISEISVSEVVILALYLTVDLLFIRKEELQDQEKHLRITRQLYRLKVQQIYQNRADIHKLFLGNLPKGTTESELCEHFDVRVCLSLLIIRNAQLQK
jgi:hypothetical protein